MMEESNGNENRRLYPDVNYDDSDIMDCEIIKEIDQLESESPLIEYKEICIAF